MPNSVDFKVDRVNPERYKIKCVHPDCMFKLTASYRLRGDCWVIGSMTTHTCVSSTQSQDHRKLNHDLICQEILPLVSNDPSLKVKTIISHITTVFNYTPSYRKAWLAKTKAIERVYGNWEESYRELPCYLNALKTYSPGSVYVLETEYSVECFGHFNLASQGLHHANQLYKLMGLGCMGSTKARY